MSSSIPTQIAETIQTAHINRSPSPRHDINPPTAASRKEPVSIHELDGVDDELSDQGDEDAIPYSVIKPTPRSAHFPPMPDLRFEQSYLHSISKANSWGMVAWITIQDQVLVPLVQGVLYNLILLGWQHWNRNARIHGNTVGARTRRWWYGVNKWAIPDKPRSSYGVGLRTTRSI